MRLFEDVTLMQEPDSFVVPASMANDLVCRMREEGIEYAYSAWDEVIRGEAPVSYDEAMESLRPFEEMRLWSVAPCVIVSRVSPKSMLQRCRWLVQPYGNRYAESRNDAFGFVRPNFWKGVEVASLECHPKPRAMEHGESIYAPLSQDEVLLAQRMVRDLAASKRLSDVWWHGGKSPSGVGLTTKELLEDMLYSCRYESPAQCTTFPTDELRDALTREALAAHAVGIAQWVQEHRTSKLMRVPASMGLMANDHRCSADFPRGIIRTAEGGFLREVATESVVVDLRRVGQSPYGFLVESVQPNLAASSAWETGTDLREVHGPWQGFISATHEEYTCDPKADYPVALLRKWVSEQDDEHVMVVEAPAKVSGTVVRVYIGWDTPWMVITNDQVPKSIRCCQSMQVVSSDGVYEEYLPASEAPEFWNYSSVLHLHDEASFRVLERDYPQVAALVHRLYRRSLELRYEHFCSCEANGASSRICKRLRSMLDNEVWPCIDGVQEDVEEESLFVVDSSRGVVASIARGEDAFGWDDCESTALPDDPMEWTVEELDLSTPALNWLVYSNEIYTVCELVARLADDSLDCNWFYQSEIEEELKRLGLFTKRGYEKLPIDLNSIF